MMPPVSANGMPENTSNPSLMLPNIAKSNTKTRSSATGTTICRRAVADCRFSNVPPQVVQYPVGTLICERPCSASATKEPMSRPRTLALTTIRRLPFSRLTWLGPGARSRVAISARGMKFARVSPTAPPRGSGIGSRLIASRSLLSVSGRRT